MRRAEWVDTLHQWFDYWLQGLRNGVTGRAAGDHRDGARRLVTAARDWPLPGTRHG